MSSQVSAVADAATASTRVRSIASAAFSRRFAGLWVLAVMVVGFGLEVPDLFLNEVTLKTILGDQAITGLLAFAILLPFVTGVFDLSVANVAGFSMVLSSWLSVKSGLPTAAIVAIALIASCAFGAFTSLLVTRLNVNSLVATLGVSTLALGLTELIAGGNSITPDFGSSFDQIGLGYVGLVPVPWICVLVLGAGLYYMLEHTPLGRRLQATGGNRTAARLAGIRVGRMQTGVLLGASLIAGFTGLVLATKIGVATDSTAPGYLFTSFAVLLFGATQLKDRPNVWGTVLAMLILGTGVKGLQLMGADVWINDFFAGAVLLVAVAISSGREIEMR